MITNNANINRTTSSLSYSSQIAQSQLNQISSAPNQQVQKQELKSTSLFLKEQLQAMLKQKAVQQSGPGPAPSPSTVERIEKQPQQIKNVKSHQQVTMIHSKDIHQLNLTETCMQASSSSHQQQNPMPTTSSISQIDLQQQSCTNKANPTQSLLHNHQHQVSQTYAVLQQSVNTEKQFPMSTTNKKRKKSKVSLVGGAGNQSGKYQSCHQVNVLNIQQHQSDQNLDSLTQNAANVLSAFQAQNPQTNTKRQNSNPPAVQTLQQNLNCISNTNAQTQARTKLLQSEWIWHSSQSLGHSNFHPTGGGSQIAPDGANEGISPNESRPKVPNTVVHKAQASVNGQYASHHQNNTAHSSQRRRSFSRGVNQISNSNMGQLVVQSRITPQQLSAQQQNSQNHNQPVQKGGTVFQLNFQQMQPQPSVSSQSANGSAKVLFHQRQTSLVGLPSNQITSQSISCVNSNPADKQLDSKIINNPHSSGALTVVPGQVSKDNNYEFKQSPKVELIAQLTALYKQKSTHSGKGAGVNNINTNSSGLTNGTGANGGGPSKKEQLASGRGGVLTSLGTGSLQTVKQSKSPHPQQIQRSQVAKSQTIKNRQNALAPSNKHHAGLENHNIALHHHAHVNPMTQNLMEINSNNILSPQQRQIMKLVVGGGFNQLNNSAKGTSSNSGQALEIKKQLACGGSSHQAPVSTQNKKNGLKDHDTSQFNHRYERAFNNLDAINIEDEALGFQSNGPIIQNSKQHQDTNDEIIIKSSQVVGTKAIMYVSDKKSVANQRQSNNYTARQMNLNGGASKSSSNSQALTQLACDIANLTTQQKAPATGKHIQSDKKIVRRQGNFPSSTISGPLVQHTLSQGHQQSQQPRSISPARTLRQQNKNQFNVKAQLQPQQQMSAQNQLKTKNEQFLQSLMKQKQIDFYNRPASSLSTQQQPNPTPFSILNMQSNQSPTRHLQSHDMAINPPPQNMPPSVTRHVKSVGGSTTAGGFTSVSNFPQSQRLPSKRQTSSVAQPTNGKPIQTGNKASNNQQNNQQQAENAQDEAALAHSAYLNNAEDYRKTRVRKDYILNQVLNQGSKTISNKQRPATTLTFKSEVLPETNLSPNKNILAANSLSKQQSDMVIIQSGNKNFKATADQQNRRLAKQNGIPGSFNRNQSLDISLIPISDPEELTSPNHHLNQPFEMQQMMRGLPNRPATSCQAINQIGGFQSTNVPSSYKTSSRQNKISQYNGSGATTNTNSQPATLPKGVIQRVKKKQSLNVATSSVWSNPNSAAATSQQNPSQHQQNSDPDETLLTLLGPTQLGKLALSNANNPMVLIEPPRTPQPRSWHLLNQANTLQVLPERQRSDRGADPIMCRNFSGRIQTCLKHLCTFAAHRSTVTQLLQPMHSQELYSLGKDNCLKMWTLAQQKSRPLTNRMQVMNQKVDLRLQINNKPRPGQKLTCFAKMKDGMLVTGSIDRCLRLYVECGKPHSTMAGVCTGPITCLGQMQSGNILLCGSTDGKIRAIVPQDGSVLATFDQGFHVSHLVAMTDYTFISASGSQKSIWLWDIRQPNQHQKVFHQMHHTQMLAVEKLNSEMFATSGTDGVVNIWNSRLDRLVGFIQVDQQVSSLKFIKKSILLCGHSQGISVYSIKDEFQSRLVQEVPGEIGEVTCISYTQGKIYVGGFAGKISIFELSEQY